MSDATNIPADETTVQVVPDAAPAPVPQAAPAPAPVPSFPHGKHPRWLVALVAVFVALLLMGLGACTALGVVRHLGGGGFRRGQAMMAPGNDRGEWQRGPQGGRQSDFRGGQRGGGFDRGSAEGTGTTR